jgi:hypothetical protein
MFCVINIHVDGCKDRGLNLLAKFFKNFLNPVISILIACSFSEYIDTAGL